MHYEMPVDGDHSPRVERKRQARKRDILRRALVLAAAEGDEVLTIGRLAEELDYTPGALYRYFPSKDALVAEVQRSIIVYLGQALGETVRRVRAIAKAGDIDAGQESLVAVIAVGAGFGAFARDSAAEFGLLSMYLSDPDYRLAPEEAAYVHRDTRRTLAVLASVLAAAAHGGVLRDGNAAQRALVAWAALQGVLQTRKLERNEPEDARRAAGLDAEELARELLDTLLVGWGARAESIARARRLVAEHQLDRLEGSVDAMLAEHVDRPE